MPGDQCALCQAFGPFFCATMSYGDQRLIKGRTSMKTSEDKKEHTGLCCEQRGSTCNLLTALMTFGIRLVEGASVLTALSRCCFRWLGCRGLHWCDNQRRRLSTRSSCDYCKQISLHNVRRSHGILSPLRSFFSETSSSSF